MLNDDTALKKALKAFEKRFNCKLCMHDYCGELDQSILPQEHLNHYCTGIKKNHPEIRHRCILFDNQLLQQQFLRTKKVFGSNVLSGWLNVFSRSLLMEMFAAVCLPVPFQEILRKTTIYSGIRILRHPVWIFPSCHLPYFSVHIRTCPYKRAAPQRYFFLHKFFSFIFLQS